MLFLLALVACIPNPAEPTSIEEAAPPDEFPQLFCTKLEECTDAVLPHPIEPDTCLPEATRALAEYPVCEASLDWLPVDQECSDLFPDGQPLTPAQALDLWCEGPRE